MQNSAQIQKRGDKMKDPICGMEVGEKPKLRSGYKGKEYGFCSPSCKQSFDKSPDRYAK